MRDLIKISQWLIREEENMNMFRKNKLRKKRDWKDLIGKQENGNIKKRLNKKKLLKCRVIHNN